MNLEIKDSGDLFSEDVEAIVNPVNCVGVMGRGLALAFRRKFPANYAFYKRVCARNGLMIGIVACFPMPHEAPGPGPRWIINFPSKRDWREPSRLDDLEATLGGLAYDVKRLGIKSLAMPAVGCGLGGLPWRDVLPLIEFAADRTPGCHWIVFEPQES